jgi:hypothetical protein
MPIPYDPAKPDRIAVRRILLEWLRSNPSGHLPVSGQEYDALVEYTGQRNPQVLAFHAMEAFWQLLVEGIVAPGMNSSNVNLPWFHVTDYGQAVLAGEPAHPHDSAAYLARLRRAAPQTDSTVVAYVSESLAAFQRGLLVSASVMLGVAAERVFLLVCESMLNAIQVPKEKSAFEAVLARYAMKPKLDRVHDKLLALQRRAVRGLPDNATLMVTAIYDLLRRS